jgi:predicted dehydrogenase
MQEKLKVGVVGMGKMGIMHAGILNVIPGVELTGVCEPAKLTNRILKKVFKKALVAKSVSEFSNLDLDALFITTPTITHYRVVKEIIESGLVKNLFVEKPLSTGYMESKELSDLIRGHGVGMVGYVRRFMVTFIKAKELLDLGVIGQPVTFKINTNSSDFYGTKDPTVSIARGGVMRDLGCYPIDLLLWYFGKCNIESASIESITGPGAVDAAQFAVKGGQDAPSGQVSVSWCAEGYRMPEVEFSIVGSKGSLLANDDFVRLEVDKKTFTYYRLNLNDNTAFWLGAPEYYREDECFIKNIRQKVGGQPNFDSAAEVELVIEEVERRAKQIE